jgi:hypothetical protein
MRHAVATCLLALVTLTHADAASVKIVALGASNTYGMGHSAVAAHLLSQVMSAVGGR